MKLIDDWRSAYKMFSVQALLFITALQSVAALAPGGWMALHVPWMTGVTWADALSALTFAGGVLGIIGRLIQQTPPESQ